MVNMLLLEIYTLIFWRRVPLSLLCLLVWGYCVLTWICLLIVHIFSKSVIACRHARTQ